MANTSKPTNNEHSSCTMSKNGFDTMNLLIEISDELEDFKRKNVE